MLTRGLKNVWWIITLIGQIFSYFCLAVLCAVFIYHCLYLINTFGIKNFIYGVLEPPLLEIAQFFGLTDRFICYGFNASL